MHFSSDVIVMGLLRKVNMFVVLLDRVCVDLFHKILCSQHCLHDILPPVLSQCYGMRHRAHSFVLPQCNSNPYKKSFINYCLIKDV